MPTIPGFGGNYDANGWPIFTPSDPFLTDEQVEIFNYIEGDYIENNPGYVANTFTSYVGIFYSPTGEISGVFTANNQTEQY
jgi:hypothetical protein